MVSSLHRMMYIMRSMRRFMNRRRVNRNRLMKGRRIKMGMFIYGRRSKSVRIMS